MRLLVDEGVPVQVLEPFGRNKGHVFEHVTHIGWGGREDQPLFDAAARRGFDAFIAVDVDQLVEPAEWRALRKSGLHHISLRQGRTVKGGTGVARVLASLIVAMPYVLADLADDDAQRIVEVALLSASARHEAFDPRREHRRYPYWR